MAEVERVPWSGYWWSFRSGGLATGMGYAGHPSPLEKYDWALTGAYPGPATAYGRNAYYKPGALSWEGLCYCWAAAAILEREPVQGGIYNDVPFYVGDKKGLLTAAYDQSFMKSIRLPIGTPLEFHQVLEQYIAEEKTAFIMDLGEGGQIWNYPVFRYDMSWTGTGTRRTYAVTIYYVSDDVFPDYAGSWVFSRQYSYYFEMEGSVVKNAEWIEKPSADVAYEPVRACGSTVLDYETIRKIADKYDDDYEPNDTFDSAFITSGGRFNLLSSDDDYFRMILKKGDTLATHFLSDETSVQAELYDPRRLFLETLRKGERQEFTIGETGNYYIRVLPVQKPDGYEENDVYERASELYLEQRLPYEALFPIHPAGSWATGLAFADPDETLGRILISQVGLMGLAEKTFMVQTPERKTMGVTETAYNLKPKTGTRSYLRVFSDVPVQGLSVATAPTSLLGGNLSYEENRRRAIYFPYFPRGPVTTRFGLLNGSDVTETVDLTTYDEEGEAVASMEVTLVPGGKQEWDARYLGVLPATARTLVASARSGGNALQGYQSFSNDTLMEIRDGALLSLRGGEGTRLVAPHVACDGYWNTFMALMNQGLAATQVVLTARDAAGGLLESRTVTLPRYGNIYGDMNTFFPSVSRERIASVVAESAEEPLSGILFYQSRDGRQFAAMEFQAPKTSPLFLSHVASSALWGTGLGVMNTGDSEEEITFSLLDVLGRTVLEETRILPAGGRIAVTLARLFGAPLPSSGVMVQIEGTGLNPLGGMYLIATADWGKLMGDVLEEGTRSGNGGTE
ncbi:MAG: hypothetical protein WC517_05130 [Patescibacteria group bacterium]